MIYDPVVTKFVSFVKNLLVKELYPIISSEDRR